MNFNRVSNVRRSILPALVFLILTNKAVRAGSATWNLNPGSGIWTTATNWTPATVPNGPGDIATFAVSNVTNVQIAGTQVEVTGSPALAAALLRAMAGRRRARLAAAQVSAAVRPRAQRSLLPTEVQ